MCTFPCQKKHFSQRGFTLIELLIVMAIIGILAALSVNSFQNSQIRARDAQRKNDLEQISHALEAYYNDYDEYPNNDANYKILGCNGSASISPVTCEWGERWADANDTVYMIELPTDPREYLNYYYESDGTDFQLYARLENSQDKDIPTEGGEPAHYNISCGTYFCNYGISSTNTTPETNRPPVIE